MAEPVNEDLLRQASFVFKGTVQRVRGSTMPEVPSSNRTLVVRVDEITHAPDVLADFAGREVTVELAGRGTLTKGTEAIFFANGWVFGEGLAVRAIAQRAVARGMAMLGATPGNPVQNLMNKEAAERFATADLVVSGRVTTVRLTPGEIAAGGAAVSAAGRSEPTLTRPISEHDPLTQEAVVEVDAVHKGEHADREVRVRFPSSTDVRWFRAPKFQPGQHGFFVLHRDETRKAAPARGAVVASMLESKDVDDAFTALHPADWQPMDRPGGVRNMIATAAETADGAEEES